MDDEVSLNDFDPNDPNDESDSDSDSDETQIKSKPIQSNSIQSNETSEIDGAKNNALALVSTLTSPLILPIAILLCSAFQQNTSGIFYMVFLIIFIYLRTTLFKPTDIPKCTNILPFFGKTTNINIFISIFSFSYILLPMIILKMFNVTSIIILSVYTFTNIGISIYNGCFTDKSILIGDIFFSLVSGVVSILIIIALNSSLNSPNKNFLFIDNPNSSKEICSVPSNQNFKCNVYQNGQLISQLPNVPN